MDPRREAVFHGASFSSKFLIVHVHKIYKCPIEMLGDVALDGGKACATTDQFTNLGIRVSTAKTRGLISRSTPVTTAHMRWCLCYLCSLQYTNDTYIWHEHVNNQTKKDTACLLCSLSPNIASTPSDSVKTWTKGIQPSDQKLSRHTHACTNT